MCNLLQIQKAVNVANEFKTACQAWPDPWFSSDRGQQNAAKAACRQCRLRESCEEKGWEQEHGIWGGLSALDRRKRDPERYAEAKARAKRGSEEFDDVIKNLRKKAEADAEDVLHPGMRATAQGEGMVRPALLPMETHRIS